MASKTDKLTAQLGSNIAESTAAGRKVPAAGIPARQVDKKEEGSERDKEARVIDLDRISPDPDQPRKYFDEAAIDRMAASLRRRGQMQPIRARYSTTLEKWIIVSGERRYRGAERAGLKSLRVVEYKGTDSLDTLRDQLIENMQREDLDPLEEAAGFRRIMEETGCTQLALAESLDIPQARIARHLALLTLPESAREAVALGDLASSSAYAITRAPAEHQEAIAEKAVATDMTRQEVQEEVERVNAAVTRPGKGGRKGKARSKPGYVTSRKIRTESKVRILAERAAAFDLSTLRAALLDAVDQITAEIAATEPALTSSTP